MEAWTQHGYDLQFDWGPHGLSNLAPRCATRIVVDVLSFTTCVDLVVGAGGVVYPCADAWDVSVVGAVRAGRRGQARYTLSPASFVDAPAGLRVILASPNGGALSATAYASGRVTMAACLRNARAVASAIDAFPVAIVGAGERWPDSSLRPALEDLLGAGAVLSYLEGRASPEAQAAVAAFRFFRGNLEQALADCASGRELRERDCASDVALAAMLDVSTAVPRLVAEAGGPCFFQDVQTRLDVEVPGRGRG